MFKEDITKCFYFGAKVRFIKKGDLPKYLIDKEFCLLGFDNRQFALIEWDKRGQYSFEFCIGSIYENLELVD